METLWQDIQYGARPGNAGGRPVAANRGGLPGLFYSRPAGHAGGPDGDPALRIKISANFFLDKSSNYT